MKSLTNKVLLATAVIMSLTACGVKEKEKLGNQEKLVIQTKPQMNADELVDAAEQLVTPYTFMLADKVLDQALEKDPTNVKAQFYKNFLKRLMVLKGIYSRVRPIITENGNIAEHNRSISNLPNSPLKKFLLEGKDDLKTEADMQNFISEYEQALEDLHVFLIRNADAEITLNLNPYLFEKEIKDEWGKSCVVVENSKDATRVECDASAAATKKMNSADLMVLRQAVGYERMVWAIYNSYSLQGMKDLQKKFAGKETTSMEQWEAIKNSEGLLKLRGQAKISAIKDIFGDLTAAARWAIKYQDRLCPKGSDVANQRRGFLFSQGLCIVTDAAQLKNLEIFEKAISGPVAQEVKDQDGKVIDTIKIDVLAWSRKAPQDLKTVIIPEIKNYACNEKLQFKDKTFGGMLPDGDFDKIAPTHKCDK